jgi:starch-binding outer membrane protein, SusD/RagB family
MSRSRKIFALATVLVMLVSSSCHDDLNPEPIDLLTDDIVLNEPNDVANVEIGLYSAFRAIPPSQVIAGDFTADMLIHNGTFSQYRELGTKQISASNASVATLWASIYSTVYIANFIIERLPEIQGVPTAQRNSVLGTAHFLRGYSYFIGLYTYGAMPKVLSTNIEENRTIARASEQEILDLIFDDYEFALNNLPQTSDNAGFVNEMVVRAAIARLYLYLEEWNEAESFASDVINSGEYTLEPDFASVVNEDFTSEAIFEVGYTIADDPGTNSSIGLNNLFMGRREIIPSNPAIVSLASTESGDRFESIEFNTENLEGNDNGWSVAKYGTADEDNNNVVVFRLAEMYLIRAEARAHQGKVTGVNSAQSDIDILRLRANAPTLPTMTQAQMLETIEEERLYELAFEGHRWYDLVRTGRANAVMSAFSANWRDAYLLWPIPQREIQNNTALRGQQNPGY